MRENLNFRGIIAVGLFRYWRTFKEIDDILCHQVEQLDYKCRRSSFPGGPSYYPKFLREDSDLVRAIEEIFRSEDPVLGDADVITLTPASQLIDRLFESLVALIDGDHPVDDFPITEGGLFVVFLAFAMKRGTCKYEELEKVGNITLLYNIYFHGDYKFLLRPFAQSLRLHSAGRCSP